MFMSQKKFMSQKEVSVRKILVREKITIRKKFPSQKQVLVPDIGFFMSYPNKNTFLSKNKVSVTGNFFCHRQHKSVREKIFCHRSKFLSQKNPATETSFRHKKVSFTETSLWNRNKSCPHACPL